MKPVSTISIPSGHCDLPSPPPYPASSSPRAQFRKGSDPVDKEKGAQGRLRTQTRTVDVKMLFNVVTLTPRFESLWFMLQRINPEKKKKKRQGSSSFLRKLQGRGVLLEVRNEGFG